MSLQNQVSNEFKQHFQFSPTLIVRGPGRVNLIGEHTDYNDGFVLPMAIDRAVWIALRPRTDRQVVIYSPHFKQTVTFSVDDFDCAKSGWVEYLRGIAWVLAEAGHRLSGFEGVVLGDVPVGSGLSSSAAVELATARAFATVSNLDWDAPRMAKLAQRAENQWVGVNCGIMDQMISAAGKANHALLIDCRSLESELVPLPPDTAVIVLDTNTRRGLVDSAYNERRSQCEEAARFFGVSHLRDVSAGQFGTWAVELDELTRRRAQHIITENERTLKARDAMLRGDAVELGQLMLASHASLRDDFEVSSDALNAIVEAALKHPACYGARMTGAGFGGCAVALVRSDGAQDFADKVKATYQAQTNLTPNIYICTATNGAEVMASDSPTPSA